jgi:hypothetical protein
MVPEDDRSFFERLADNWYGQVTDENVGGWEPGLANQAIFGDPTEAVGYYRLDTGNPTRDAIFSVLLNNFGMDNAYRATLSRESGDMGWENYWKELTIGAGEVALFGYSAGGKTLLGAGKNVINLLRRAPVTTVRGGVPVYQRKLMQLGGEIGPVRNLVDAYTPITIKTARTGARPITQLSVGRGLNAVGRGLDRFADVGWKGAASALGRRVIPQSRGGKFGALTALGLLGFQALGGKPGSQPALTAEENAAATGEGSAQVPTGVVSRTNSDINAASSQARVDIAGINQQYSNILRELQGMYQLSETDEERERLRFMLADIEAQRDAGLQAISEGYAQTVSQIREQAVLSGERTTERAQRYGQDLEASADRAAQRMMLQNAQQQEQFRGLGSGSQSPVNEWVGLMSAMAPAQQLYTQRMGDISQEGMEWLANTVGAQGQAQGAELQRLAAATRSGTIANQQAQVSDRINRERELQRAAILDTMSRQAGAIQSAQQFNASQSPQLTAIDRANTINELAAQGYSAAGIRQYFETSGLGNFDPSEEALSQFATTVPRG